MSRAHISEVDEADRLILSCSVYPLSNLLLRLETQTVIKEKRPNGRYTKEE